MTSTRAASTSTAQDDGDTFAGVAGSAAPPPRVPLEPLVPPLSEVLPSGADGEGVAIADLGEVFWKLTAASPFGSSCRLWALQYTRGPLARDWASRDLLPLPWFTSECLRGCMEEVGGEYINRNLGGWCDQTWSWTRNLAAALNYRYAGGGGPSRALRTRSTMLRAQRVALGHLGWAASEALGRLRGPCPTVDWSSRLKRSAFSYTGEDSFTAEKMTWPRIEAGLPPREACAAVRAVDVCVGPVREALLDPQLVLRDPESVEPLGKPPRIWAERTECTASRVRCMPAACW